MKIKLLSLHLENFRGLREFSIAPNGEGASIIGANGTGKSTLAAAFLWLLDGKDAQGRDNYNIFPLDADGRRVSGCSPCVTARLDVDGTALVLQRSMAERWIKRRGAAEAEYTGDETRFVVNEVPVSAGEYARRIAGLVPEKLLPLLTSAAWFSEQTKDYKERRRLLMEQFGGISSGEVFDACPDLQPLREALGSHSVEEYGRICADRRKRHKDALATIPARIDENRKQLDDVPMDAAQLKDERGKINVEIAKLRYAIEHTSESEESGRLSGELQRVRDQLALVPKKRQAMEQAVNAEWKAAHTTQLAAAIKAHSECECLLRGLEADLLLARKKRLAAEEQRDALRAEWTQVNAVTPSVQETCPTCGQPLPTEQVQQALERFNTEKSEQLGAIAEKGSAAAQAALRLSATCAQLQKRVEQEQRRLAVLAAELESVQAQTPPSSQSPLLEQLDEQERSLLAEQQRLQGAIADIQTHTAAATASRQQELARLQQQADTLSSQLAQAEQAAAREKRIEALEEEKRAAMRGLEQAEQGTALCQEFTRQMVAMLTQRVNRHFPTVRWKLFEEQKNGGLREVCEATVDGVPYGALNTAARMQANVEIVAAFGEAAGISMPLFLDNRESVTALYIPDGMQIIDLKVVPGAALGQE